MTKPDSYDALLSRLWKSACVGDTGHIRRLALQNPELDLDTPNASGMTAFALAMEHGNIDTARTIHALWLASHVGYTLDRILDRPDRDSTTAKSQP